ncbi:hypothetical protein DV532_25510 (plasmid) [Pseudomonas sp. Leaf58]|uniref:hypothetical protein n=1 Tax=Pseudomonas sp. Leaf58 TaxID=1736226 RepID=UPI0006FE4C4C|nr:hypothetical protein [Pseudomonas sp. Leaf58]AYG47657.1 hypothetical protein DV532_25510 [Pseudomonas sp. Leaf58]KQN62781.1 hypothetical protein ASF02_11590 [Pseudomonas sp. Leaf58]
MSAKLVMLTAAEFKWLQQHQARQSSSRTRWGRRIAHVAMIGIWSLGALIWLQAFEFQRNPVLDEVSAPLSWVLGIAL